MLALLLAQAMNSPWWEGYEVKERFLCGDKGQVVVERNDAQASLISGRYRSTLFREASSEPGLHFRNGEMQLLLWGDSLTLQQQQRKLQCIRTDQA